MNKKKDIAFDWLRRYTGTDPSKYGDWILLTNFHNYVEKFAERFGSKINGIGGPMTSSINKDGLGIINFGIGSANAATIMDLSLIHISEPTRPERIAYCGVWL